jgi:hypothetical protein
MDHTLASFVGKEFDLTGVETGTVAPEKDSWQTEAANTLTIILDGNAWMAKEDPSDGYRSSLASFEAVDPALIKNRFPACRVRARAVDPGPEDSEIVEFVDINTGKVVLEIGTANSSDYYPSFVANFNPEAMAHNTPERVAIREEVDKNWGTF